VINSLPTGRYGEVLFEDSAFDDFPKPEFFLHPDPDVHEGPDDNQGLRELSEHTPLLGLYVPMHSPGQLIFFSNNLRRFYWSLVLNHRHGLPYLTPLDLRGALDLVIRKTYQHELFHFHCDVLRQLLASKYRRNHEEALAVAWSRQQIIGQRGVWNSKIGRMNRVLYTRLLDAAFAYRSPGYRDWPQFADDNRFRPALLSYLADPNALARLEANGISNLPDLLVGLVGRVSGGLVESAR
jgi:hypothetical protein